MNRAIRLLVTGLGLLLALLALAVGLTYYFLDLDKLINTQLAEHKPELEQKLGRKIEVGPITTSFLPILGGKVQSLTIGPDPTRAEDDRPLLKISSVGFEIALWEALATFGHHIRIKSIYVDGLQVSLVRYPDGTLSYQDILDRQPPSTPPAPDAKPEPMNPRVQELLQNLSIDSLKITNAEFRLADHDTPTRKVAEDYVRNFNVNLANVRLSDPIQINVDAAFFADKTNFRFQTKVGPLPADLQLRGPPRLADTQIDIDHLDLSKLTPYLGHAVPVQIDSAVLSSSLKLGTLAPGQAMPVEGFLEVKDLEVHGGKRFDTRLDAKLTADLDKLGVEISKLEVKLGVVDVVMAGALRELAVDPHFSGFTITSSTLDPEALLSYYPPAKADLPPGFQVSGVANLEVRADGDANRQTIKATLDADPLDITYPGKLLKPKGVPMAVRLDGQFTKTDATLTGLEFILDQLDVVAHGTVKNFSHPTMDLTAGAKPFAFDRLARLLPEAAVQLQKEKATATGNGSFDAHVQGSEENLDAALHFALLGVKLDVPGTKLDGDLKLKVEAKGDVSKNLHLEANLDANAAVIQVAGKVNKDAKTPLQLEVVADRAGDAVALKTFVLDFADLHLDAKGTFDLHRGTTEVAVNLAPLDLEKLAKTITAIPEADAKGGRIDAKVRVEGNPNQLETMSVVLDPFDGRFGRSDLHGSVHVTNLVKPHADLKLSSTMLDIDQLAPPKAKSAPATPSSPSSPRGDDPGLRDYAFDGQFDLKRVLARGYDLQNFKGHVKLAQGVLTLDDCAFQTYQGSVSAKGTTMEIWRAVTPFHANLVIKGMNMNEALSAQTQYADVLYGTGNLNMSLSGTGTDTADLERSLTGTITVALTQGRVGGASLTSQVLGPMKSALSAVPGLKTADIPSTNTLGDVNAEFEVRNGKLTLTKPITTQIDGNPLNVTGNIGIGGELGLTGTYSVSPALVKQFTSGVCSVSTALPVPVKINGTIKKLSLVPDVVSVGTSLLKGCLSGAVAGALENQAGAAASKAEQEAKNKATQDEKAAEDAAKKKAGSVLNNLPHF